MIFHIKQSILDGRSPNPEAKALRSRILTERGLGYTKRMDALRCSLDELVQFAALRDVRLGLENRSISEVPNDVVSRSGVELCEPLSLPLPKLL